MAYLDAACCEDRPVYRRSSAVLNPGVGLRSLGQLKHLMLRQRGQLKFRMLEKTTLLPRPVASEGEALHLSRTYLPHQNVRMHRSRVHLEARKNRRLRWTHHLPRLRPGDRHAPKPELDIKQIPQSRRAVAAVQYAVDSCHRAVKRSTGI